MSRFGKGASARLLAVALAAGLVGAGAARAEEAKPAAAPAGQPIDVVICLDVSGSMEGLFGSAKTKLWDIVNDLAKVKPTPELRVGLYSYGHTTYDPKAGWVRKEVDLTSDLDEVYRKLNALTINGGEEYVARVCRDALVDQKWSADKKALKIIFVAGNEPVDQDKQVHLKDVAKLANEKGVVVNTIYCTRRGFEAEAAGWRDFAVACEGRYASIDQDRGTVVINAPQDKELAELSGKLNKTYVCYGREGKEKAKNQAEQDSNAAKAGAPVAAARAQSKASGVYNTADWDLVDRLKRDPKFDIKTIKEEDLSEELRKIKPAEREAYLKKKLAEREELQKKIDGLNTARQKYVAAEMKKKPSKSDQAFDAAMRAALKEQCEKKGMKIPE